MCKTSFNPSSATIKSSKSFSLPVKDNHEKEGTIVQFFFRIPVHGVGYKSVAVSCDPFTTTLTQLKDRLVKIAENDSTKPQYGTLPLLTERNTTNDDDNDFTIETLLQKNHKTVIVEKNSYVMSTQTVENHFTKEFLNDEINNCPVPVPNSKLNREDIYLSCGSKILQDNDSYLNNLLPVTFNKSSVYPITIHVGIKHRGGCFLVSATIALILFSAILLAPITCGTSLCVFPFLFPLLFVLPLCLL